MLRSKLRTAILIFCAMGMPYQPSFAADRVYQAEDFGILLHAPKGRIVCPVLSWTHVHGFNYNVSPPLDCRKNTERTRASVVGIAADYNTAPWTLRYEAKLVCKGRPFALTQAQLARMNFRGRKTIHCAVIDKGTLSIFALTEQGWVPDMKASCVQYDAYLITRPSQLEKDLPAFEAFLNNVTLTRAPC